MINTQPLRRILTPDEIIRIREERKIQILEFNITNACQLRCPGCYKLDEIANKRKDLPVERFKLYIDKGLRHGLEEVWLLGGEPTLHLDWKAFVLYAKSKGIEAITIFSNTLTLGIADIDFLKAHRVRLIGKLNVGDIDNPSFDELRVQAEAIGRPQAIARKLLQKIRLILNSGLQKQNLFILENFLRSVNLPYATAFWRFCRREGIVPNLELLCDVTAETAKNIEIPSESELRELIAKIRAIEKEFGRELPHAFVPHFTHGCTLHANAIAINHDEKILSCAPSNITVTDFSGREPDFDEVLDSPLIKNRRLLTRHNIEGRCKGCEIFDKGCFGGCRTAAESASGGNAFAESQICLSEL